MPKKARTKKRRSRTHMATPNLPATEPVNKLPQQSDPPPSNASSDVHPVKHALFSRVAHLKLAIGISILVILYVAFNMWMYLYGPGAFGSIFGNFLKTVSLVKTQKMPPPPAPTPTPTPLPTPRPIPHGKMAFTSGQSDKTVPQLSEGSIDPYDPAKGATQTVTIAVKHTEPVTQVSAMLKTDTTLSRPFPLTLTSGTNTDGQWQGSWKVEDTYLYTYQLILQATSGTKTGTVEITLR